LNVFVSVINEKEGVISCITKIYKEQHEDE